MSEPEQKVKQDAEDFLTPGSFIRAALAAHRAFKFAIVVAGLLAIVIIIVRFGVNYAALVFGAIALVGLMVLFLVFAQASKLKQSKLDRPALVLVWSMLVVSIAIVIFLTASVFFSKPLPIRDWITEQLIQKKSVIPPGVLPVPDENVKVQKAVIIAEVTDAYKATGLELGFFDDWGRPPMRQTLRVNQTVLTGTSPYGRVVSISIDPRQLPTPKYYNANSAQISTLGSREAPEVIRFFSAYEQYREALVNLTSAPGDFNVALINATVSAREAVTRGHAALCAMGTTPPRLFPNGGFPEPVLPDCSGNELLTK